MFSYVSNLVKSVQSVTSAETLHLGRGVKYACGQYQLHASSLLQLGENEDITTRCEFHQPAPSFPNTDLKQPLLSALH